MESFIKSDWLNGSLKFVWDHRLEFQHFNTSHDTRFQTMWYVRPAKPQISLRIRAV